VEYGEKGIGNIHSKGSSDSVKRLIFIVLLITTSVFAGIDAKSGKVVNVATPTDPCDAANKQYVDDTSAAEGHNMLSVAHGDTTTDTVTRGSLFYGNSDPNWDELVLGSSGYILRSDGTDVVWSPTTNITALGTIASGVWNATAIDISSYTNLVAGTNITLSGDTLNVDDAFLVNDASDSTTGTLTMAGLIVDTAKTPSSATDTGTQGHIAWDSIYLYVCTETDTWKRVALSSWGVTGDVLLETGDSLLLETGDALLLES